MKNLIKRMAPSVLWESARTVHRIVWTNARWLWLEGFHKQRIRKIAATNLFVNLGCGSLGRKGWINIDRCPSKDVYYADLSRGIPLRAGQARHIHCEHFLGFLDYATAKRFLAECHRVLSAGGSLRLILPDAAKYIRAYCQNDRSFFDRLPHLGGHVEPLRTRMEIINQSFRMGGDYKFAWDFETLSAALQEAGFVRVEESRLHDVPAELDIDGEDWWRPFESLYVNAWKAPAEKDAQRFETVSEGETRACELEQMANTDSQN